MNIEFKLGVVVSTVLLSLIHIFIFSLFLVSAQVIEGWYLILSVLGMAYMIITLIAHARANFNCMKEMTDPNLLGKPLESPKNIKEAINILRNPVTLALLWRFKREWSYIKKTANLDFK